MKKKISKNAARKIAAVLSQIFAMTMAAFLLVIVVRYMVMHEKYGSYIISPYENTKAFEATEAFQYMFGWDIAELSEFLAISSQLETDGAYDKDRLVDVFRYNARKEYNKLSTETERPELVYRVGDLIEWFQSGGMSVSYEYMPYEEAVHFLSEEEMIRQKEAWDNPLGNNMYEVAILEEEFKPQNVDSISDLQLPEGMKVHEISESIHNASEDLYHNYQTYWNKREYFSSDKNLKYMFVSEKNEILYTNVENKEQLSLKELKKAFKNCNTYLVYDYDKNTLEQSNLDEKQINYYKGYFREYNYCFPEGGTVYIALQTKSSSAFGPYNDSDFYAISDAKLKTVNIPWEQIVGLAILFALLAIVAFIVFLVLQEKKKKDDLKHFDAWFTEIALAFAIATTTGVIGTGAIFVTWFIQSAWVDMTMKQSIDGYIVSLFVTFSILYVMLLLYAGSLARRIKAKALWKGSMLYYILHNIKQICRKALSLCKRAIRLIMRVMAKLVNNKSFMLRTLGPYALFLILNVGLLFVFHEFGMFLAILLDIAVAVYLYFENKAREEIVNGISRICDGDIEYQINTEKYYGENKVIAEAVNQIGEAVKTAVQISRKDERLKADLITNVSHDIKTPLTSIINYVDLLKRENIPGDKAQEYIRILDEKSQRLKQLTLDLVEASKISSGNITLEMNDIDVRELLNQAIGEYKDKMEEKHLSIVESYPEEESVLIYADSRRMWRVMENLLLNICKYAMEGTRVYVDIHVEKPKQGEQTRDSAADSFAQRETVEIILKNISAQPLNIPAEELTERFIRGDISRSTEGSGLGLSIVENLTIAQGGRFKIYLDGDLFKVSLKFPRK